MSVVNKVQKASEGPLLGRGMTWRLEPCRQLLRRVCKVTKSEGALRSTYWITNCITLKGRHFTFFRVTNNARVKCVRGSDGNFHAADLVLRRAGVGEGRLYCTSHSSLYRVHPLAFEMSIHDSRARPVATGVCERENEKKTKIRRTRQRLSCLSLLLVQCLSRCLPLCDLTSCRHAPQVNLSGISSIGKR